MLLLTACPQDTILKKVIIVFSHEVLLFTVNNIREVLCIKLLRNNLRASKITNNLANTLNLNLFYFNNKLVQLDPTLKFPFRSFNNSRDDYASTEYAEEKAEQSDAFVNLLFLLP